MKEKPLCIATNNSGKLREFNRLLSGIGFRLFPLQELGITLNVVEDGKNYHENAQKKASTFMLASGMVTLADDSGLEVDLLNGAPGIYSARYAPQHKATDKDRRNYLLNKLEGQLKPWSARFRCVIAIAIPGMDVHFSEGICEGQIISEERGNNGFGYDPIFYLPEREKTMAELPEDEKNRISHRGRAIRNVIPFVLELHNLL